MLEYLILGVVGLFILGKACIWGLVAVNLFFID